MMQLRKKSFADKLERVSNEYEKERLLNIQANKRKLESMNIKRIATSMTSMVDSTNEKRRKGEQKITLDEDDDDDPSFDEAEELSERKRQKLLAAAKKHAEMKEGRKKSQGIPPLSVANFLKVNNKQRRTMIGDDTLQSISSVMKVVEQEIEETIDRICRDDVCDTEDECHITGNVMVDADHDQITLCKAKKTRGTVYCRKLTALAPGERIFVEFNADGIPIGQNASIFAFFLGEQVRNRAVFPIQVNGWEEFKEETLDHLWSCIMEKFDFDHPDLRRESVMKHARSLFRDSRYKLRRKYILEPNLTSKEDQLKNKPKDMLKADWKYLVDVWRIYEKSTKGKENRSLQKMPHYTGTKSHARVKEELGKKLGRECSRVDILLETRKRKSINRVNPEKLACNMHAIYFIFLSIFEDEGLNQMTDEQIITEVLGKDFHGYLRCYGRGKSITQYFGVNPSRLNLAIEVMEVKKTTEGVMQEAKTEVEKAKKEADEARKEAEEARKDDDAAKKEAEAIRNEVDIKIAANNKLWEDKLVNLLKIYGIGAQRLVNV
ncbi:hypothetical protein RND81_11G068400 [Saponaria officinalis]|uniref:Transposase n=1 Tax=Saponaria officinalis TaxID=3572 RepID=A0AAW1HHT0_SAPOF